MAFSFTNSEDRTYYLHTQKTKLKNGSEQTIYFFAKEIKEDKEALDAVPDGYMVSQSKNGLPVLMRASKDTVPEGYDLLESKNGVPFLMRIRVDENDSES